MWGETMNPSKLTLRSVSAATLALGLLLNLSAVQADEVNPDDYESGAVVLKKGKGGKLHTPMDHSVLHRRGAGS